MTRAISLYFISCPRVTVCEVAVLTVYTRRDGTEFVVRRGRRFTLDTSTELFFTWRHA